VIYQLSWKTLPGLQGLSCSEFRAVPTNAPEYERGVAVNLASDSEYIAFLRQLEEHFSTRRFTSTADAFDMVKAYAQAWRAKRA
jgi:hypothetical protein